MTVDFYAKLRQHPESMEYVKFCNAVQIIWEKSHPDIPIMALGSKLFDNNKPIITFHLQRREPAASTPKPRVLESFSDSTTITNLQGVTVIQNEEIQTSRMDFDNTIVFTVHVPVEKGGGEIADKICEEFERFMIEHVTVFMKLGAKNLRYGIRFYDDNLLKEFSQNSVRRFISYTLYTQIVTQTKLPILQQVEVETRIGLDALEKISTTETHTSDEVDWGGIVE